MTAARDLSQHDLILNALFMGPLTSLDAIRRFGCTRLAAVIHNLRQDGFKIDSLNVSVPNRYGDTVCVAQYHLRDRRRARSLRVQRIKRAAPCPSRHPLAGLRHRARTSPARGTFPATSGGGRGGDRQDHRPGGARRAARGQGPDDHARHRSRLPKMRADSVAAQVSIMARGREITRHHSGDGILRYSLSPGAEDRPMQAPTARVYAPPAAPAPVRVVAGDAAAAVAPKPTPATAPQPPHGDGTISLQALVRTVVESQPDRRWTLSEITAEVGLRIGKANVRPDQVRARLHNLCRSGHSSPLRRMPADGTWMANTPATRAQAQAEEATRTASVKAAATAAPPVAPAPEARTAPPTKPLQIPQARQGAAEEAIERAAEARGALRTLIASVITHVPDPPPEVILAMQRGLCLFAAEAR